MKKLCIIYGTAPKYREAIFRAIDSEYDCDWLFGETKTDIREMDISQLKHAKYYKSYGDSTKIYWQGGILPALFSKKYRNYLVLAETRSVSFWLAVFIKKLFFQRKKLYGWSHGWYGKEGRTHKLLDRLKIKCIDGLFVYNRRSRQLMIDGGVDKEKIFVIGNSLDYDRQLELRNSLAPSDIFTTHFNNDNHTLLFIGRLTKVKRLDLFIEAVRFLKEKGKNFNVVLVGDGEQKEQLQQLCKGYEIPVWFFGACYDEATNAELVYNSDLCVSPGNIGLTAIHSLMFGTPAITNNDLSHQMPEFEAIIPGRTGDFFEVNNPSSIASCVENWFAKHKEREIIRHYCYEEIERQWNPRYQMGVLKKNLKLV